MILHGRDNETGTIDQLLTGARDGRSGALVIRGEAGIGKSALFDYTAEAAATHSMRVLRGNGIESERELPFAGLHLLLGRFVSRIDGLPDVQARALRGALGMEADAAGDRFLVGLAVLTLLADLAEEAPLVCLVDDAQWLDQESADALLFAARRLEAEGIVMLFAARDVHAPDFTAVGLPELRLAGLDDADSGDLLAEQGITLSAQARRWVLDEARGNPLALVELPSRGDSMYASPYSAGIVPTSSRIQQTFAGRIAVLPERSRTLVLVASAEGTGDLAVILDAAGRLGASMDDLEPAERHDLIQLDGNQMTFRHPLIRTAAYQDAPASRRISAHRALAETLSERGSATRSNEARRAWHWAAATTGPDESIAAMLEESAEHARSRGGNAAVASAYERAAALSVHPAETGRRLTAAAQAAADAGQLDRAVSLVNQAREATTDPVLLARLALIHAGIVDEQGWSKVAHTMLADAANSVAHLDPETSGQLFFHAAVAAWNADDATAVRNTADQALSRGVWNAKRVDALSRVVSAQYQNAEGNIVDGADALRELMNDMADQGDPDMLRERQKVGWWHLFLGEYQAAYELATELERDCRDKGAIGVLALVLMLVAQTQLLLGKYREALASGNEGMRIAEDTGQNRVRVYLSTVLAQLAAIEGDEQRCRDLTVEPLERGVAPGNVHAAAALSLLDLGAGRYEPAVDRMADLVDGDTRQGALGSIPNFIEAAVRLGQPWRAQEANRWYQDWATTLRKSWSSAIALRCRALLAEEQDPESSYTEAIALHQNAGSPFERARTELLYGEWLRRVQRRSEARTPLRSAMDAFERLNAKPWAERARNELRASGEKLTASRAESSVQGKLRQLTPQELQVVRLAATGQSNREIGAQLFLSPRTVGYHLSNAYPKLGVASRRELIGLDLDG